MLIGVAVGIGSCALPWIHLDAQERARLNWPTAQGVVLSADADSTGGYPKFTVTFVYEVDAVHHVGRQSWVGYGGPTEYRQGAHVPVHYNPTDPSKAVVNVRAVDEFWPLVLFLSFLIGVALYLLGGWVLGW